MRGRILPAICHYLLTDGNQSRPIKLYHVASSIYQHRDTPTTQLPPPCTLLRIRRGRQCHPQQLQLLVCLSRLPRCWPAAAPAFNEVDQGFQRRSTNISAALTTNTSTTPKKLKFYSSPSVRTSWLVHMDRHAAAHPCLDRPLWSDPLLDSCWCRPV